jgi:predicted glycogen debranching enzyme
MSISYKLGRSSFRNFYEGLEKEWLLTNGVGGFANLSITGARNRVYSSYLIASLKPPMDRKLILANVHESIKIDEKEYDLVSQEYNGEIRNGHKYLNRFQLDIVPTYHYQVEDVVLRKTITLEHGINSVVICYEIENGISEIVLNITPLFNYRNPGEASERSSLRFDTKIEGTKLILTPKEETDVRINFVTSEGNYYDRKLKPTSMATPNYLISENEVCHIDKRNGFLGVDNHYTPYDVVVPLKPYETKKFYVRCSVSTGTDKDIKIEDDNNSYGLQAVNAYKQRIKEYINKVQNADDFMKKLIIAADHFIVDRASTNRKTILAGYPWFSDWGRDTMIAMHGLTLSTKRFDDAREVLESFSMYIKDGLVPNVFPDDSLKDPMYNTIDASLWYFVAVYEYLKVTGEKADYDFIKEKIYPSLIQIIDAYQKGTKYGIGMDSDGLVKGGSDLDQLTWMDVRVGNIVVTPRHGKAVEINALWYNSLCIMTELTEYYNNDASSYRLLANMVKASYVQKFWNEKLGCLYDVIEEEDKDKDDKIRPNQIYAVSLPFSILDSVKEKSVVQVVYKYLYTPYGLRSLADIEEGYKGKYIGKLINRDLSYHMGTTWGYLMGGFIQGYVKVHNYSKESLIRAKEMCGYFEDHMNDGCLGQIAEIFDGDFPCTSRGCFAQAWSVGEILRVYSEHIYPYLNKIETK